MSKGSLHVHSFQGSFFLEHQQKPRENGWFLKIMMVEQNGESTPRTCNAMRPYMQRMDS